MNIYTIGIDLGKTSFHLVGLDEVKSSFASISPARSYYALPRTGKSIGSAWKPAEAPIF